MQLQVMPLRNKGASFMFELSYNYDMIDHDLSLSQSQGLECVMAVLMNYWLAPDDFQKTKRALQMARLNKVQGTQTRATEQISQSGRGCRTASKCPMRVS